MSPSAKRFTTPPPLPTTTPLEAFRYCPSCDMTWAEAGGLFFILGPIEGAQSALCPYCYKERPEGKTAKQAFLDWAVKQGEETT